MVGARAKSGDWFKAPAVIQVGGSGPLDRTELLRASRCVQLGLPTSPHFLAGCSVITPGSMREWMKENPFRLPA